MKLINKKNIIYNNFSQSILGSIIFFETFYSL